MPAAIPAIEAARFYPDVPRLFRENQVREAPSYEDVIYRVTPRATSADVDRALAFLGSKKRPPASTADALNRVLDGVQYPQAASLLELKGLGLSLPEAAAMLHFQRPAFPLYREPALRALRGLGFAVEWRETLDEDGVGAYEGFIAALDFLKKHVPYAYVPETNVFLSRLIEAALHKRGIAP